MRVGMRGRDNEGTSCYSVAPSIQSMNGYVA